MDPDTALLYVADEPILLSVVLRPQSVDLLTCRSYLLIAGADVVVSLWHRSQVIFTVAATCLLCDPPAGGTAAEAPWQDPHCAVVLSPHFGEFAAFPPVKFPWQ